MARRLARAERLQRHPAGRPRLVLRISASRGRGGGRPAVPVLSAELHRRDLRLRRVVSHRRLHRGAPIQLRRSRDDLPRLYRPRDAEFPVGADPAVPGEEVFRRLDRRADGREIHRPALDARQGRQRDRAHDRAGHRDRRLGHRRDDPPAAGQPARRAAETVRRHRARQGPAAGPPAHQVSAADVAQSVHRRHRQPAAADDLGLRHRRRGDEPAHLRADAGSRPAEPGSVSRGLLPAVPLLPHRRRHVHLRRGAGDPRPAHPPRRAATGTATSRSIPSRTSAGSRRSRSASTWPPSGG
jgi:hypothetical protein